MPASKPKRARPIDQLVDFHSDTPEASERRMDEIARLVQLQASTARVRIDVDLIVGENRINHNLGRMPRHVTLMPTTADASFAWAVVSKDERQLVVSVVGVAQPGASLEVS